MNGDGPDGAGTGAEHDGTGAGAGRGGSAGGAGPGGGRRDSGTGASPGGGRGGSRAGAGPGGSAEGSGRGGSGGAAGGRDPGLQPERTRLAWRRTTLSGTVAAVLAVRATLHGGATAGSLVVCAVCCLLWLGFLLLAQFRIRRLDQPTPPALTPRLAAAAVLATAALAVCAAALVV
ncbi:DUF202 domain-containing protein [Streptomyces sp. SID8381]|nr:DUF202 domain-containing protein [Streptomyces sp. SID8381]